MGGGVARGEYVRVGHFVPRFHGNGFCTGGIAGRVSAVNPHVVHGAAAHIPAHFPMIAVFIKGTWVRGLYAQRFNGTEGFCVRQGHDGLGIGLVVQPITDGEFDVVLATGVDNVLTLLRIHGHGLFTPHVLTSIGGNERKLSVGAGGGDHVNHVDLRVVRHLVHIVVVVYVVVLAAVLFLRGGDVLRVAGDNRSPFTMVGPLC